MVSVDYDKKGREFQSRKKQLRKHKEKKEAKDFFVEKRKNLVFFGEVRSQDFRWIGSGEEKKKQLSKIC